MVTGAKSCLSKNGCVGDVSVFIFTFALDITLNTGFCIVPGPCLRQKTILDTSRVDSFIEWFTVRSDWLHTLQKADEGFRLNLCGYAYRHEASLLHQKGGDEHKGVFHTITRSRRRLRVRKGPRREPHLDGAVHKACLYTACIELIHGCAAVRLASERRRPWCWRRRFCGSESNSPLCLNGYGLISLVVFVFVIPTCAKAEPE